MKNVNKLIAAMALVATLPGTLIAQELSGQAGKKNALPFRPRNQHLMQNGDLTSLGSLINSGKQTTRVDPVEAQRLPQSAPEANLAQDIVPGAPFAVFVGTSAHNPVALIDAGTVPVSGQRVLGLVRDSLSQRGARAQRARMSTYFRCGDVIICVYGGDAEIDSSAQLVLEGPGASVALGKGATLKIDQRVDGLRGGARVSAQRGAPTQGGDQGQGSYLNQGRRGVTGARASAGNNGTLPLK